MTEVKSTAWKPERDTTEFTYAGVKLAWLDRQLNGNQGSWGRQEAPPKEPEPEPIEAKTGDEEMADGEGSDGSSTSDDESDSSSSDEDEEPEQQEENDDPSDDKNE